MASALDKARKLIEESKQRRMLANQRDQTTACVKPKTDHSGQYKVVI